MKLLSTSNAKLEKGEKMGYRTYGLSLSPHTLSGKNFCPHASAGCAAACLNTAGQGVFSTVQEARLRKSHYFISDRASFIEQLKKEIKAAIKQAEKNSLIPCFRLNVVSDLPWHNLGIMDCFPSVQFYDYTPNPSRMVQFLKGELPSNYHLTFSRKEDNAAQTELIAEMGGNVAAVFSSDSFSGLSYLGKEIVNGDESDLRFLDKQGVIVGLKAKGKAKKDTSGFVVQLAQTALV